VRGRIAIGGAVAQKPGNAGHTWQFLQYLLGFRRLGYDVLLVDSLEGGTPAAVSAGVRWLDGVMRRHGLERSWTVKLPGGDHAGIGRRRALDLLAGCDLLLNVMGFVADEELLAAAPRRAFLDTDPGFAQMWRELGLADILSGHDAHVTIGERIGSADCAIPACGINWITTPQPVVLTAWPRAREAPRRPFTSVASWRGAYGPIDFRGRRYGLRVHQFRRFAALPSATGRPFEMALSIDPAETGDLALLRGGGWTLVDPRAVASTTSAYRSYIAGSAAELMVAKGIYVQTRSGWFSERSICYLASGRPVLAQDTGIAALYPVGRGLLTFRGLDEAAAGVEAIASDYDGHAAAARELAEERFDSDHVLTRLLERL
jgi:hypothetical protein